VIWRVEMPRPLPNASEMLDVRQMEMTMSRTMLLPCAIVAAITIQSAPVLAQQAQSQSCHMEQQCHWENFKKVCVYVKVCR
jgi:hypothetical protein